MTPASPAGAAVIVLGNSAAPLGRRISAHLPGARLHARAGRGIAADVFYVELLPHLAGLFAAGTPIVGLCASGILIRALAPHLAEKHAEPPVVAVAEDGSAVVPLVGGHRGANALAREIAGLIGCQAAITTASDLVLGLALDALPPGWRAADPDKFKDIAAAFIAGEPVSLAVEAGNADWLAAHLTFSPVAPRTIRITDRMVARDDPAMVLHPPVLALGVGCARDCPPDELLALSLQSLEAHRLAAGAVALVASLDLKMDEPAVQHLADTLGVPARFFSAAALREETPRLLNPSETVFRAVGCYGVAEGAALAAVGADGALVVTKQVSAHATCAIARAPAPLDARKIGRARGRLSIVGIGPGDPRWRTAEADAALAAASDIVGLQLYLDLVRPQIKDKSVHASALGDERARVSHALDLAAEGREVALVSSGDAGIYGLASLVFELIDRTRRAEWALIDITVVPGVSALQAAAARLGAPLGHDFCAISLSDLLTPWAEIERRLEAAAAADFVVALYNPRSARRQLQLTRALEILRIRRPPETPAAIARNLGRSGERVVVTTLARLDEAEIDMLTLVVIGSSASRLVHGRTPRFYTPRGYRLP